MITLTKPKQSYIWPIPLLITVNVVILTLPPSGLRYGAALILLGFLPSWIWLQAFFDHPHDIAERVTLAVGLSLALMIVAAMVAAYLPGPLTAAQLLIIANIIIIPGLLLTWRNRAATTHNHQAEMSAKTFSLWQYYLILAALLLLAAGLRLPRLGYAEFHEDEAEALMLGPRLFQGEDYALFLHRKGPAQMLVPVSMWLLTGQIDETLARLPFTLSSILSVATLFFLGRRWFNNWAGITAALLWATNGYAIGFGRMAQYQALIFFMGPLALYCLYLAWAQRQPRYYVPVAILLAACLLAHFDALLLLPAAGYLALKKLKDEGRRLNKFFPLYNFSFLLSLGLFLVLIASFYLPYLLDPEFKNTLTYLSESRVKPGLLYDNLSLLRRLDSAYSSRFYLPLLAAGLLGLVIHQSRHLTSKWRWALAGVGFAALSTLSVFWRVGAVNLTALPWLLLGMLLIWFAPNAQTRVTWLMFGAGFIGYVFLVDDPRTHLYIMYPGAVLLAGAGWSVLWVKGQTAKARFAQALAVLATILLLGLMVTYDATIFLSTESVLTQLRQRWDDSAWQIIYDRLPKVRDYFGYPKREGWKAIGALRTQGQLLGDFRSVNEDFIIPIWYNYGQARSCYDTPAQFFVRVEGDNEIPPQTGYAETGQIQREGETRLRIFTAGTDSVQPPTIYRLEDFEATFDQLATPAQFTHQTEPSQPRETQFGAAIRFLGYDLPSGVVKAGNTLYVNLYWQALENPGDNYRAFVHLTDGANLWGQQDDDPACRLPTSIWRAGQRSQGQFRLPIKPDTPPGRYPLIIGLYRADTLVRLKITTGAGQPGDDFLWLQDVEVKHN